MTCLGIEAQSLRTWASLQSHNLRLVCCDLQNNDFIPALSVVVLKERSHYSYATTSIQTAF